MMLSRPLADGAGSLPVSSPGMGVGRPGGAVGSGEEAK